MMDRELHYLLLIGFNCSNKAIVSQTSKQELMPGQPKILEFLLEHNGCTQKEVGLGCVLDKSTVTSLLSRMEEQGLITKTFHEKDKRSFQILLTEKGKRQAEFVKKVCNGVDQTAWQDIPQDERQAFLQTFRKILKNFGCTFE